MGFDAFVGRCRYPGRGIALGRDDAGVAFAAYWLTGRSAESRNRRITVGAGVLDVSDIASGPPDPLRHYTAIIQRSNRIVVGNGIQVREVVADLDAGSTIWEALSKLESEPDPPIRTPRITATATVRGDEVEEVILCGAVAHPRWPKTAQHNVFHTHRLEVGQCHAMTTYDGDTAEVSTSGQPTAVEVDDAWPTLLQRIWHALDPAVRVGAAVVPLPGDLRCGRFIGRHQPVTRAGDMPFPQINKGYGG